MTDLIPFTGGPAGRMFYNVYHNGTITNVNSTPVGESANFAVYGTNKVTVNILATAYNNTPSLQSYGSEGWAQVSINVT